MNKKIILYLIISILLTISITATRYINYEIYEGIIDQNGNFTPTTNPINDSYAIGFVCSSANCTTVSATLWNGAVQSTGPVNTLQLTYPTVLQSTYGYGVYYYKPGYITWEQNPNWWGTDPTDPQGPYSRYLSKKQGCHAPIDNLTVINDAYPNQPIQIKVNVSLDATTYAAIAHAGPLDYVPSSLAQDYYSVNTTVTLTILDSSNNTVDQQTQNLTIAFSGSQTVNFIWVPTTPGTYRAIATTNVTDLKCSSSIEQSTWKDFTVLNGSMNNSCYTLINNLQTSDPFPIEGENLTILANKISNYVDNNSNLTPIPTNITLTITYNNNNSVVNQQFLQMPANPDSINPQWFNFSWLVPFPGAGNYTINVTGIANSSLCAGLNNTQESEYIGLIVSSANTAPVIAGLPDLFLLGNSGFNDNLINLSAYANDVDNDSLTFTITSQTNASLVNCTIDANNFIDCTVLQNINGISDVTVEVSDGSLTGTDTFRVNITQVLPQCSDGQDNDNDTFIDAQDPGCYDTGVYDPNDDDETDTLPECSDFFDNDNDTFIDAQDPGCYDTGVYDPNDDDETDTLPECSDFFDNDNDTFIDAQDPGCYDTGVYDPNDDDETDTLPECSDFFDNDNDTFIDAQDPGCYDTGVYDPNDDDETDTLPECSDFFDNDNDTFIDAQDPGCYDTGIYDPNDDDETDTLPECSDFFDNDGDGYIDYPADFGCESTLDDSELNNGTYQCNNGIDDDNDTFIDQADPMCINWTDDSEFAECNDGIDNDNDTFIDFPADPDCTDLNDDNESGVYIPECNDTIDNDGDGLIDYPADPGCNNTTDDNETDEITCYTNLDCGIGMYMNTTCNGLNFITTTGTTTCFNPGTINSYCGINETNTTQTCNYICSDTQGCDYTQCSDSIDNDNDGLIDMNDPGCENYQDNDETGPAEEKEEKIENDDLLITRLRVIEDILPRPGDLIQLNVFLENVGALDLKNLKITAIIQDLGVRRRVGPFDLDEGDEVSKNLYIELPFDINAGIYDIRVTISNDKIRRIKYRDVVVI